MEKIFNIIPSVNETFISWFILQHLCGYKPFFTKMRFEKEFKGNLQIGRIGREKSRGDFKEQKAKELNNKKRNEMWYEPKF